MQYHSLRQALILGVAVQLADGGRSVKPARAGIDALAVIGVIRHSSSVHWGGNDRCRAGWLYGLGDNRRIDASRAGGNWIEIATNAGIEDIAPIANSDSWGLLHRQESIAACL